MGGSFGSFFDALDAAWQAERTEHLPLDDLPFRGGWLLYLGYELAGEVERKLRLPSAPQSAMPVALALRCPAAIVVDHQRALTLLVAVQLSVLGLYLPPVFKRPAVPKPPQTIISLPVHTAV